MATTYAAPISATQVGSYFVQQYYQVLQQQPDYVHQFYTDSSSIVRVDGDSAESASSLLEIHSLLLSVGFSGIKVKTINSLESWNGGVLVVVSGSVKLKDVSGWRDFVQTFFLAPQEKGFFVLNDVFHFGDMEVKNQPPAPVVVSENNFGAQPTAPSPPHAEAPASDYALEEEAREYVNMVNLEGNNSVGEYSYSENQQDLQEYVPETETVHEEPPLEEEPYTLQNNVEALEVPEPSWEEPAGEQSKLSYASILRAPKGKSPPSVSVQQPFTKSAQPTSDWQPAVQQTDAASTVLPDNSHELADEGLYQEGESLSVYVRNLPSSVSTLDIVQEFKNFGTIKQDGVFLRNRKDVGVCYAFVEFEDVQGVQNALKASPILLAGRQVYIEERRPNNNSASRGGRGRGGRGRGGRSGGRTFGRGGYQDSVDYNRVKSNGFRAA